MLIDTHAHLTVDAFQDDLEEVLARARDAGVRDIVVVSETLDEAHDVLALCARYPALHAAIGLFPTYLDLEQADALVQLARDNADQLVAIGEVGLDYWKVADDEGREVQRAIFARFIALAVELDVPVNVHSRSAGRHAVQFLLEHGAQKVQMHAFDGKASAADPAVDAGWFFSVPPSIVRSPQKQKLVKRVPLEQLLLESDAPVLGPDPQLRNEPANITGVLDAIAAIKKVDRAHVAAITRENTLRLYGERCGRG